MRIGNLRGGGHVVKTLLGFCPCYRHRPQPAPTRPPQQQGSKATNAGKVKTPRGGGLGVVVWFNWKPCEDAGT